MTRDGDGPDPRIDPPVVGDERPMLDGWLDYHRDTLLMKCADLSDEQLKTASAPPSPLTLLGLVRHMAEVERGWFSGFSGTDDSCLFCNAEGEDRDLADAATADVAADLATYRAEVERHRIGLAGVPLDATHRHFRGDEHRDFSLRWVYLHLIEEYARHNGHADLIRERIDGRTGS